MSITPPNHSAGISLRLRNEFSLRNFEVCPAPQGQFQAQLVPTEKSDQISRIDRHFHREIFSDRSCRKRLLGTTDDFLLKYAKHPTFAQNIRTRKFVPTETPHEKSNEIAVQWKKENAINFFTNSLQELEALLDSSLWTSEQKLKLEAKMTELAEIFSHATCEIQNATSTYEIRQIIDAYVYNTVHALNSFWQVFISPLGYAFENQVGTLLLNLGRRMDKHLINSGLNEALSPTTRNMLVQQMNRCIREFNQSKTQNSAPLSESALTNLRLAFDELEKASATTLEEVKNAIFNQNALDALVALRTVILNKKGQLASILQSSQRDLLETWSSDFKMKAIHLRLAPNPHLNRRRNV